MNKGNLFVVLEFVSRYYPEKYEIVDRLFSPDENLQLQDSLIPSQQIYILSDIKYIEKVLVSALKELGIVYNADFDIDSTFPDINPTLAYDTSIDDICVIAEQKRNFSEMMLILIISKYLIGICNRNDYVGIIDDINVICNFGRLLRK